MQKLWVTVGLGLWVALSAGCTSVETAPELDEVGVPIPKPAAFDDWLRVVGVDPPGGQLALRPEIRIQFNAHLEDDLFIDFDLAYLSSGGFRTGAYSEYEVSTRTLIVRPASPLIDGLRYRLAVNPARLESVTGAPPDAEIAILPRYIVNSELEDRSADETDIRWAEVEEIFEHKCWPCHQDPGWSLNPLTMEAMIGEPAIGIDQILVVPFDSADSYLMHKVIPDYPLRLLGVQPPEWSGAEPLSDAEIARIEEWIDQGAR